MRNAVMKTTQMLDVALVAKTGSSISLKNGVFWVVTPCTQRNNPEDIILHSHRRENLKSYIVFLGFKF
jgi:hypothetical protein